MVVVVHSNYVHLKWCVSSYTGCAKLSLHFAPLVGVRVALASAWFSCSLRWSRRRKLVSFGCAPFFVRHARCVVVRLSSSRALVSFACACRFFVRVSPSRALFAFACAFPLLALSTVSCATLFASVCACRLSFRRRPLFVVKLASRLPTQRRTAAPFASYNDLGIMAPTQRRDLTSPNMSTPNLPPPDQAQGSSAKTAFPLQLFHRALPAPNRLSC